MAVCLQQYFLSNKIMGRFLDKPKQIQASISKSAACSAYNIAMLEFLAGGIGNNLSAQNGLTT